MTEKQVQPKGLTNTGLNKIDRLLDSANDEQLRVIIARCADRMRNDKVVVEYNQAVKE